MHINMLKRALKIKTVSAVTVLVDKRVLKIEKNERWQCFCGSA
jgi:hypothetical protein